MPVLWICCSDSRIRVVARLLHQHAKDVLRTGVWNRRADKVFAPWRYGCLEPSAMSLGKPEQICPHDKAGSGKRDAKRAVTKRRRLAEKSDPENAKKGYRGYST